MLYYETIHQDTLELLKRIQSFGICECESIVIFKGNEVLNRKWGED